MRGWRLLAAFSRSRRNATPPMRSAVTGRSAKGASTRQEPKAARGSPRARQREWSERRHLRTPRGLRPDQARVLSRDYSSTQVTRGAVAPRRGAAARCAPMKGARRPTCRVVQLVPLKETYRPVNQASYKQKLRPQLLYIDTQRTQLFPEIDYFLLHIRNMHCQIYTGPPGCCKSRTMLSETLNTPGLYLIASPRTALIEEQAVWLSVEAQARRLQAIIQPIHSDQPSQRGTVGRRVSDALRSHSRSSHVVLIITHETLMSLDPALLQGCRVCVDEVPDCVASGAFSATAIWSSLDHLYSLEPVGDGLVQLQRTCWWSGSRGSHPKC